MMNNSSVFKIGLVLAALLPVTALAGTRDDINELQIGQQELQAKLNSIAASVQNKGLLEMSQMLEQMHIELRELRSQVEEQNHELEGLRKRQRELYLDIDRRLNDMQLGGGASTASSVASQSAGVAATVAGSENASSDTERVEYKAAFELLKEARYSQAIEAFETFLAKYPKSKYSDNAQYWLGEANYVSRNLKEALIEFTKVLDQYPSSAKIPDAKLKIGYTYYELKKWDKARQVLSGISTAHPNSSVASLAEQRLQRMSQEGH